MEEKICIYDNPVSFSREYWRNGKRIGWYTKEFLDQAPKIIQINKKSEKHLCQFHPGRIIGNPEAIGEKYET